VLWLNQQRKKTGDKIMTTTFKQPVIHKVCNENEYTVFIDTLENGTLVSSEEIGFCVSQKEAVRLLEEAGCDESSISYAFSTAEDI
jgi:hypothetical protein